MEFVAVLAAAVASYAFGAGWYSMLAKPWAAAAGLTDEDLKGGSALPYVITFVATVIIAWMMRHIFEAAPVESLAMVILNGFGLGLFIASPWIVMNYIFAMRPRALLFIDVGYATVGSTIMALVLGLFGIGLSA